MTKEELGELKKLDNYFALAQCICNPAEFQVRQINLLHAITRHILEPLRVHEGNLKSDEFKEWAEKNK